MSSKINLAELKLLVLDIDNTVFDWVTYYVHSFSALLDVVSNEIGVHWDVLANESMQVFENNGSIEYPFLVQELPSVNKYYGSDIELMLDKMVRPARDAFLKTAEKFLKPYDSVLETFDQIRSQNPMLPIVALTDAPRYVAMWKLNKLGVLNYFDAVYGLTDPRIPICEINRRVKVDPEILLKHLKQSKFDFAGKIRILPEDYEKPGIRGLKTVLMDYELDHPETFRSKVLWVGDNLRKDVGLGNKLGVLTAWAEYGTKIDQLVLNKLLKFSPPQNVHKNVSLKVNQHDTPKPVLTLNSFSDLILTKV
jgi:FMN phosphatase YigB (HAD superfamily)